jgi:hypothetical protein
MSSCSQFKERHFPRSAGHYFHDLAEETIVPVERLEAVIMALSLAHADVICQANNSTLMPNHY